MTTAIDEQDRADTRAGEASRPPRSRGPMLGLLVVAVIAGLALGRFAFFEPGVSTRLDAEPRGAQTLEDRVAALERQVEASPDDLTGWQALGVAYTDRAIQVGDPSFYDLAGRAFDRADGIEADHPDTLLGRGRLQLSLHQFSDALATGEAAVEARPSNADSWGVLVDAQVELGRYEDAAESLQTMLDLNPGLEALSRASYLRELYGDLPGAIVAMRQADAAGSDAPLDVATIATLMGNLQLRQDDLDAAEESYARATAREPGLPGAIAGTARVMVARGDVEGAIALLAEAVERQPVPEVALLHAELLRLDGRTAEADDADEVARALADLQSAAGQIVDLEVALFEATLGRDPGGAVDRARAAHDARPDNVFVNDALGWALHRAGDGAEAVQFTERAVRLDTADSALHARAALVFDAAGDVDRARTHLERALRMSPWTALAHQADAVALAERLDVSVPTAWAAPPTSGP